MNIYLVMTCCGENVHGVYSSKKRAEIALDNYKKEYG
ncbi:unnamed protein product, partial [marine sediment metagenome]